MRAELREDNFSAHISRLDRNNPFTSQTSHARGSLGVTMQYLLMLCRVQCKLHTSDSHSSITILETPSSVHLRKQRPVCRVSHVQLARRVERRHMRHLRQPPTHLLVAEAWLAVTPVAACEDRSVLRSHGPQSARPAGVHADYLQ